MFALTLSDPDSEDTEEDEECCWGLGMDMGESALCGDTESLCCSSDPVPVLTTQGSCSATSGFGGATIKETRFPKFMSELQRCLNELHLPRIRLSREGVSVSGLPLLSVLLTSLPPHFLMIHSL